MTAVTMTENKDNNITAPLMHMCNVHQRSCLHFIVLTQIKKLTNKMFMSFFKLVGVTGLECKVNFREIFI